MQWLLLGHAVQSAQSPDEVSAMNANDFTVREKLCENAQGLAVIGIIECGNQDQPVGDVEVAIACRKPLAIKNDGRRHGQLDNVERLAIEIARRLQAVKIFRERQMVFVIAVVLNDGDESVCVHEAGDV